MSENGDRAAPADLVITGGRIYTLDPARPRAGGVAIRGDRIVAVGAKDELRSWIDRSTEVLELGHGMLLPGFQDCHVHAASGGLSLLELDLAACRSTDELAAEIRRYAAAHPGDAWVLGTGWGSELFPEDGPTKGGLDELLPDRPALLSDRNRHNAWANGRALALAGITRHSSDPPGGRIAHDEVGDPTGLLAEAAIDLVLRVVPPITLARRLESLVAAQTYLHSVGITSWQDALIGRHGTVDDSFDAYLELDRRGELTARVVGALWFDPGAGPEQVSELSERRARAGGDRFRASTVKVMVDGSMEGRSASMFEPFLDVDGEPTDNVGLSFFEPDALKAAVEAIDAAGFQAHVHVLGDRACADALDALDAATAANGRRDRRHHLAHLHVVRSEDVPRLGPLGVAATMQPLWAAHGPAMDLATIPWLGSARAARQYPTRSLAAAGATLAFGSDWPVSSPDPVWGLHVAVNRMLPPAHPDASAWGDRGPFIPEERIDLGTAIAAYTLGAAYVNRHEDRTGSIEVGKLADLVLLDRDLYDGAAETIGEALVVRTLAGGRTVYER